jgi:hypothetical protein
MPIDPTRTVPDVLVARFLPGPDSRPFRTAPVRLRRNPPVPGLPYPTWHARFLAVTPDGREATIELGVLMTDDEIKVFVQPDPEASWGGTSVSRGDGAFRPSFDTGPLDFFQSGDRVRILVRPAEGK